MLVFPNLILIGVQIRTIRPVEVDRTEVFLYPAMLKGVPREVNVARLRGHEAFYGPTRSAMFQRAKSGSVLSAGGGAASKPTNITEGTLRLSGCGQKDIRNGDTHSFSTMRSGPLVSASQKSCI